MKDIFQRIYLSNKWGSKESKSGKGSELSSTEVIRKELPELVKKLNVKSILDIPCGDYNYMKEIDLNCDYIGADIVPELITSNSMKYPNVKFMCLDIVNSKLPKCDLVIVRDCLVHLSNKEVFKALDNIKASGCKYILTTSFPEFTNKDISTGQWRPINLAAPPFNYNPIMVIEEGDRQKEYENKSLYLYENEHNC